MLPPMPEGAAYPGDQATARDYLGLADTYRAAAVAMAPLGRKGQPVSRSPYRLVAIQAVELYLNAHLMHLGKTPPEIRGLQHDLGIRADLATLGGLKLRKRTLEHLKTLASSREYLVTRYGPELSASLSQVNRLAATLDEVATKVRTAVQRGVAAGPSPSAG